MTSPQAITDYEESAIKRLQDAKYRITMPRVQVIRTFAKQQDMLFSAYSIHEDILSSHGKIDVVSVYRIISTLRELGIITEVVCGSDVFYLAVPVGNTNLVPLVNKAARKAIIETRPNVLKAVQQVRDLVARTYPGSKLNLSIDISALPVLHVAKTG